MKDDIAIIIPAYNPNYLLEELIKNLNKNGYTKILVINDGSKNEDVFKRIAKKVTVLTHKNNFGKGTALKTGFKFCIDHFQNIIGVITVDADGQHLIKDINQVYNKLAEHPDKLILGSRDFKLKNVPFRSFLGNKIMKLCFKLKTGVSINDTQTGLRGIPSQYLENFYMVQGCRYEYETNILLYAVKNNIKIIEEFIESVYLNNNESSHFKVIKDSLKIIIYLLS